MKLYMIPYKMVSKSAKLIAQALGVLRLKKTSPVVFKEGDVVLNWGVGQIPGPEYLDVKVLNHFYNVLVSSNKLATLNVLRQSGIPVPEFCEQKEIAMSWASEGVPVLARKVLNGHSGDGLVGPIYNFEDVPEAPLYVKYIKKSREYRVHVVANNILINEKKRRRGVEANYHVRSHANGWVFCKHDNDDPLTVRLVELAYSAVKTLRLDFGAVDIIYNSHYDKLYVLEVNTAPGVEKGSTLEFYANSLLELKDEVRDI